MNINTLPTLAATADTTMNGRNTHIIGDASKGFHATPIAYVQSTVDRDRIIQRCNAYPRLVELLRVASEYAALHTGGGAKIGTFPAEYLDARGEPDADRIVTAARNALRELGEV